MSPTEKPQMIDPITLIMLSNLALDLVIRLIALARSAGSMTDEEYQAALGETRAKLSALDDQIGAI